MNFVLHVSPLVAGHLLSSFANETHLPFAVRRSSFEIHSQHVLTEDTLERSVQDGKLYTKRLLSKTNPVPKWGERFYNIKSVKIVEESICDPVEQTLTTYTRNIALTKVMVSSSSSFTPRLNAPNDNNNKLINSPYQNVVEKVVYKKCEENPDRTIAIRSAWVDSQVFGFSRAIRSFGFERFKKNCGKMVRITLPSVLLHL